MMWGVVPAGYSCVGSILEGCRVDSGPLYMWNLYPRWICRLSGV